MDGLKRACTAVKNKEKAVAEEEARLRAHLGDFMTPANSSGGVNAGYFRGILEKIDYEDP